MMILFLLIRSLMFCFLFYDRFEFLDVDVYDDIE